MCAFLTIRDGGGHWLVIVGVAAGNRPHGVSPIVMGTDKQVPSAFPHQALQLLQRVHTHLQSHQTRMHCSRIVAYFINMHTQLAVYLVHQAKADVD